MDCDYGIIKIKDEFLIYSLLNTLSSNIIRLKTVVLNKSVVAK